MRPSKAFAVITFLTLLSSFSIALSPTNASEDHSQHLTKLAVPNGVVTVPDSTSTVLRFSAIPNATSYKVRVYAAKGENPLRTIAPFNSGESISALTPNSTYKITVQAIGNGVRYSNSEESRKVSVTTLSALAVPAFSLNPTVMTATVGQLFNSPTPVSIGGAIANFSIDAGIFPINGLSFNTSTGVISGTPITAWIPNTYTITAHNSSGVALQSFTLITQAAPTVPNVSGLIRSAANASLIASGFVAGAVTTTTSGATSLNDGHVQSQSPTAGSALAAGGSVAFVLYTYVAPISTPTVTSISPTSGTTAGGKAVTITGTGFTLTITSVTIGGVAATSVVRVSATSITAVTPAHVAGAVDVVVTNSDTGVGTGTGLYAYVAPLVPDLTALLEGAATSALTTNGFVKGSVTTTTSGANPGNNGLVQSQTPTAGSALTAGGSVDLVLYAYVAPTVPNVSGLTQAAAEASLIVNGFILGTVTTTTSGANSGNDGQVQSQTPTAGSALTAGSSVDLILYLYVAPLAPHISSLSPTYGSSTGGTNVTIIGTGFQPGAIVYFGRKLLSNVQVIDTNTITGTTVGGYFDGGTWTVVYNSGVASNNDVNFYTYGPPSVSSISNASSTLAGGTQIVFTGTFNKCSFGPLNGTQASSFSVTIGGVAASNILITGGTAGTGTTLTATTPAGAVAGIFDIQITLVGVGTVSLPGAFSYVAPTVPNVSGLTQSAAYTILVASGFVTGAVTTTTSGANPGNNGLVQSQTPTAGSTLTAGGSVDLVRYAYVAPLVPNVSGLAQADAEASLITNGFILGTVTTTTSGANPGNNGLVQSQTPTAGSTLTAGGSVDLVLYAALHGVVPTIVGAPTGTAYKYLGANFAIGISTGTTTVGANWLNDGKIATQSLSGDQFYGSIIDYTTYAAPRGVVPTIVGLSIADAITALGANFVLDIPAISGAPQSSSPVGATALNDGKIEWQSLTGNIPYGSVIDYWVYFYIAPAAPVVTAAGAPSLGGTATATDINLDGIWDLIATPAVGYTFTSWGCDASQIPASTSTATTTVTPSANTTCIATFTAATTYSVTYYGNVNDSTVPWAVDGPYIEAADVTVLDSSGLGLFRTGYSFAGWNTQADGLGGPTPQPGYTFPMPAANVELYAQWVNNTFNITWSDNGGAGTSGGDSTYIGGSQITGFPTMLPTYSGFKFIGWNTSSDGLGTDVSSGYMPRIIWPNSYSDITLYAKWANNTFNITWDQNFNPNTQGHWPSSGDSTYVGGSAVVMPMQPVQDGYAFAAWQASDSSTSVSFSYVPIAPFGDITFTAVWTAIDISVDPILDAGPMNPWTYWDGGQSLTLTGSGFIAGTTVTIGGSNASITSLTDTSITVLTPIANDPGHMTVVVTSPNGSSASTTYFYQIT